MEGNALPKWLEKYQLFPVEWNGVRGWFGIIPVAKIEYNKGQIEGLPANPRQWSQDELDRLKASIQETPELTLARGVLAFPIPGTEKLAALGGNMRYAAAKSLKEKTLPAFIYPEDTTAEKLMEIVIKDNGTFGAWDVDALANQWDVPFKDWGVPDWVTGGDEKKSDEKKSGEKKDLSGKINYEFKLEITCKTESEQEQMYNELTERGYQCRILTL